MKKALLVRVKLFEWKAAEEHIYTNGIKKSAPLFTKKKKRKDILRSVLARKLEYLFLFYGRDSAALFQHRFSTRRGKTRSPSLVMKKACSVLEQAFWMKSGDYLSSRRLTASTFGVKELNFCVRNGNRWILFAIITAMVIYLRPFQDAYIYVLYNLHQKINNYIANLTKVFFSFHIFLRSS